MLLILGFAFYATVESTSVYVEETSAALATQDAVVTRGISAEVFGGGQGSIVGAAAETASIPVKTGPIADKT